MYKENVEITDWGGSHFVINKETIGCRLGNLDYTYFPKKQLVLLREAILEERQKE